MTSKVSPAPISSPSGNEANASAKPEKIKINNRSRKIVMCIIYVAFLVDYMLTTTVVPIIPDYLIKLGQESGDIPTNGTVNYSEEGVVVGALFGSKSVVQLAFNMIAGPLTNRIGFSMVLFMGFVLLVVSTFTFAFSRSYLMLFLARSVQGVGSAFTNTAGLGLTAKMYTEEKERGKAIAFVLGGLAVGALFGPTYGGLLYEVGGLALPFVILGALALVDGGLQAYILRPRIQPDHSEGSSLGDLLVDPYVLIGAGAIFISNMAPSMLEPTMPLWMMERWGSSAVVQGLIFFPLTLGYLVNSQVFGALAHRFKRWRCAVLGLIITGLAGIATPFAPNIYVLVLPITLSGLGVGMVDSTMFPTLGTVVDKRHHNVYGSVYAIGDSSVCVAFALGPFVSGALVKWFGFTTGPLGMASTLSKNYTSFRMSIVMGVVNLAYIPLVFFLRAMEDDESDATSANNSVKIDYHEKKTSVSNQSMASVKP